MTRYQGETVWEFNTKNFRVALEVTPEDMDPADSFEFDEDIEAVRNGDVEWFSAKVAVYGPNDEELAADHLGGCAYKSTDEFYTSHRDADPMNRNSSIMRKAKGANTIICHYFPGMVSEAIRAARNAFKTEQSLVCGIAMRNNQL